MIKYIFKIKYRFYLIIMEQPSFENIKNDKKHIYIKWDYFYLSIPDTINFKKLEYNKCNDNLLYIFNSIIYYPNLSNIEKIRKTDIKKYLDDNDSFIHSDYFKEIYKDKKLNKNFFLDLRNFSNKIKINKLDKDTIHYIVPYYQSANNFYSIAVIYVNNNKIPNILKVTEHFCCNFMTKITEINNKFKKINIFNSIEYKLSNNINYIIDSKYSNFSFLNLLSICYKFVPCLSILE